MRTVSAEQGEIQSLKSGIQAKGLKIQRTPNADARLPHHMGVNLRCPHMPVAEQSLHIADVRAVFQQMRG